MSATGWRERLVLSHVTPDYYESIIQADRKFYPTPHGLNTQILDRWCSKYPQFGLLFKDPTSKEVLANCIVVPLNKHGWAQLTEGQLSESELDESTLFDGAKDNVIGLHIYHLEKSSTYPADLPSFGLVALEGIADILCGLQKQAGLGALRVCGLSGLTVTKAGIALFSTTYGCRERSYICKEHIMQEGTGGPLQVHVAENQEQLEELLARGLRYVLRARMMVVTPDEPSLVWCLLGANT